MFEICDNKKKIIITDIKNNMRIYRNIVFRLLIKQA